MDKNVKYLTNKGWVDKRGVGQKINTHGSIGTWKVKYKTKLCLESKGKPIMYLTNGICYKQSKITDNFERENHLMKLLLLVYINIVFRQNLKK